MIYTKSSVNRYCPHTHTQAFKGSEMFPLKSENVLCAFTLCSEILFDDNFIKNFVALVQVCPLLAWNFVGGMLDFNMKILVTLKTLENNNQ